MYLPVGNDPPIRLAGRNKRQPTSVGQYSPQGDSPYGCVDMAGNVWELTRSHWGKAYPYRADDGREDLAEGSYVHRVMRGGVFDNSGSFVRCAYHRLYDPRYRADFVGFRVVVSPSA